MVQAVEGALMDAAIRGLISAAPSAVMTLDAAGRVTSLNRAAEQLFSTSAEHAVGQMYQSVLGASLADRLPGLFLRSARRPEDPEPHLLRATLPDGRRVELRANVGPIKDLNGRMDEVLFVAEETAI